MEEAVEVQSPSNAAKVDKKKQQAAQLEADEKLARILDESDMPEFNYDSKKDTNAQMNDRIFSLRPRRDPRRLLRNADAHKDKEQEQQSDYEEEKDSEA